MMKFVAKGTAAPKPLLDLSQPTSSGHLPHGRAAKPLRAAIVVVHLALVATFGVCLLEKTWPQLNEIEQVANDASVLHVEYCPNLVAYSGSGARYTDILSNGLWSTINFVSNVPGEKSLVVDETRMLSVIGKVGVRWLSFGLIRTRSLQLTIKFVAPEDASEAATHPTLSDTGKQWDLVSTGNPAGEYCVRPTLLNTTSYLLSTVARGGFVTVGRRKNMFDQPLGLEIGEGGFPRENPFCARDVWAYLVSSN